MPIPTAIYHPNGDCKRWDREEGQPLPEGWFASPGEAATAKDAPKATDAAPDAEVAPEAAADEPARRVASVDERPPFSRHDSRRRR